MSDIDIPVDFDPERGSFVRADNPEPMVPLSALRELRERWNRKSADLYAREDRHSWSPTGFERIDECVDDLNALIARHEEADHG